MTRPADIARLLALAAIWGASFVFIRVVAAPLGPVATATSRVLIAGAVLVAWLAITRQDARVRQYWRAYLFIGVVGSALPFLLYPYAALTLPASYMVILNAVTPLFAVVLSALWLGEPLTPGKVAGIGAGIAGVALVSGAGVLAVDGRVLVAVAACVAATLCYAIGSVWLKRHGSHLSPQAVAAWSQLCAGFALLAPAALAPPPGPITAIVVANLLALALLCSAVAYLLYFRLIRDLGPTRALTVTFLMPAFGMAFGALFLGESITWTMLAGAALIVGGTWSVLRTPSLLVPLAPKIEWPHRRN
jgi:drug/metabolite transporter (DMT)-like permease